MRNTWDIHRAAPPLTVDLSATPGELSLEWFNPSSGETVYGGTIVGGASQTLTAPFFSDAVAYLRSAPDK